MILLLVCLASDKVKAAEGRIRTLSGKEYRGVFAWESQQIRVINVRRGTIQRIPLSEVWNLTIDPPDFESVVPPDAEVSPEGFPLPWQSGWIGEASGPVSFSGRDGAIRIESRGTILSAKSESAPFVFQRSRGNRELVARISRATATSGQARAGLMFRSGLESGAPSIFWGWSAADGDVLEWSSLGRDSGTFATTSLPGYRWFKLKREGDSFSAYRSRDGLRWLLVCQTNAVLAPDVLVGVAAAGVSEFRTQTAVFERVQQDHRLRPAYPVHVDLVSGSSVESADLEFDESGFRFSGAQPRPVIRREQVARVIFQPVPGRLEGRLRIGQPGVLLTSGEFLEGEVRSLLDGSLLLDSVLLGQRHLDAFNQVIGAVLRPATPQTTPLEVRMMEGSVWRATRFEVVQHWLQIQEPLLGECRLPLAEVLSLERDGRW